MTGFPITAFGAVNALGANTLAVKEAWAHGRTGLRSGNAEFGVRATLGSCVDELAPLPGSSSAMDTRQARLAWAGVREIEDAARSACTKWGPARVALVLGTSTGGIAQTERAFRAHHAEGVLPAGFDLWQQHAMDGAARLVAQLLGILGPVYVLSTACSSSGKVFGSAKRLLAHNLVDAVVVGGVDTLCEMTVRGFHALEVLSPEPTRPLSADRAGINLGEGAAFALLEREGTALARLLGVGESSDAHHMSAPHPQGRGAAQAMAAGLVDAGVRPAAVGHVNAHATGTRLNDAAEAQAIAEIFGPRGVPVLATKGLTGHLLGAAGATEAVLSMFAIESGHLPPSVGCDPVDPDLAIDVVQSSRELKSRIVVSNSFAFGGSNVAVVLGGPDD